MRAGRLDREIIVERVTATPDDYGVPVEAWQAIATLRAQLVDSSTTDQARGHGAVTNLTLSFRTRFLEGLTLADRIQFQGASFDLKAIKEIGRRRGLELSVERQGQ